jgi:radical SAM superfamily enzyme YgiQ (UPF0313 family)
MRILFLDPPSWQLGCFNLGLAYLSAVLRREGHEVLVLDMRYRCGDQKALGARVRELKPHIIGLSLKTASSVVGSQIAEFLWREFRHVPLVLGGPHISVYQERALEKFPHASALFVGEAETTFPEYCRCSSPQPEEWRVIRPRACPDVNTLPWPDFSAFEGVNITEFPYPFISSRGCPFHCVYCSVGDIVGPKWRARPIEDCIMELRNAHERLGFSQFQVLDDNFTLNVRRAKELCRVLARSELGMKWYCHNGIRADCIDDELADLMKEAGCTSVAFGIEHGDPEVFNHIGKGETLDEIERGVRAAKKAGLRVVGYFIQGLPGDNLSRSIKSLRYAERLGLDSYTFNALAPYPGTPLWDWVQKNGHILMPPEGVGHFESSGVPDFVFETDDYPLADRRAFFQIIADRVRARFLAGMLFPAGESPVVAQRVLFLEGYPHADRVALPPEMLPPSVQCWNLYHENRTLWMLKWSCESVDEPIAVAEHLPLGRSATWGTVRKVMRDICPDIVVSNYVLSKPLLAAAPARILFYNGSNTWWGLPWYKAYARLAFWRLLPYRWWPHALYEPLRIIQQLKKHRKKLMTWLGGGAPP